jgi:hypothetical protein
MNLARLIPIFAFSCALSLIGCATWHGDEKVETEPAEGSSEGPGLFTGKKGGIIFEVEPWTGPSPYEDTAE